MAANFGGTVRMESRPDLANPSSSESDLYEELLVNPALLNLTVNRGAIDCGGLIFVLVRYGSFFQLVQPVQGGHVSVAVEPSGDPLRIVAAVQEVLRQEGLL
ncbi:MAG: hypothetical protein ACLGI9_18355 [Thermoanaerobaculia bacterium]